MKRLETGNQLDKIGEYTNPCNTEVFTEFAVVLSEQISKVGVATTDEAVARSTDNRVKDFILLQPKYLVRTFEQE